MHCLFNYIYVQLHTVIYLIIILFDFKYLLFYLLMAIIKFRINIYWIIVAGVITFMI